MYEPCTIVHLVQVSYISYRSRIYEPCTSPVRALYETDRGVCGVLSASGAKKGWRAAAPMQCDWPYSQARASLEKIFRRIVPPEYLPRSVLQALERAYWLPPRPKNSRSAIGNRQTQQRSASEKLFRRTVQPEYLTRSVLQALAKAYWLPPRPKSTRSAGFLEVGVVTPTSGCWLFLR